MQKSEAMQNQMVEITGDTLIQYPRFHPYAFRGEYKITNQGKEAVEMEVVKASLTINDSTISLDSFLLYNKDSRVVVDGEVMPAPENKIEVGPGETISFRVNIPRSPQTLPLGKNTSVNIVANVGDEMKSASSIISVIRRIPRRN